MASCLHCTKHACSHKARRPTKPAAATQNLLFADFEGGKAIHSYDNIKEALAALQSTVSHSEPWLCRASTDIVDGLFGASGMLKAPGGHFASSVHAVKSACY